MSNEEESIYQLKITLRDSKPPIWRRVLVNSNCSFWDLHCIIQDAMGWEDCHLHNFYIDTQKPRSRVVISFPEEEDDFLLCMQPPISEIEAKLYSYINLESPKATYEYDFGDSWEHIILLEKILPIAENEKYPQCLTGKRACPPEDSGGIWSYEDMLEAAADPKHEHHKEIRRWLGKKFDPAVFDSKSIKFHDPKKKYESRLSDSEWYL
jgi:hypothetical protein